MAEWTRIMVGADASGAWHAARDRMVVMIVDVIDMSTTLESALDAGAYSVLGASPDETAAPVRVDPGIIGEHAASLARPDERGIILVVEPRVATEAERLARCSKIMRGIERGQGSIEAIVPNLGAETPKLAPMGGRVVVAVTATGGVAYDAAFNAGGTVVTGTIARTPAQKGRQPAASACERARAVLTPYHTGIAVIAASSNSLEDVLAAQYISNMLLYYTG